jgi:hypothetical protein
MSPRTRYYPLQYNKLNPRPTTSIIDSIVKLETNTSISATTSAEQTVELTTNLFVPADEFLFLVFHLML